MGSGGTNDVVILMTILVFLVGLGFISPLIQEATNVEITDNNVDFQITDYANASSAGYPELSTDEGSWSIFANIFIAIFWVFPWFPIWLTIFHIVIRFILVVVVYRLARSGAG